MSTSLKIIGGIAIGLTILGAIATWFLFPKNEARTDTVSGNFATGENRSPNMTLSDPVEQTPQAPGAQTSAKKIFKIADGAVAGATFIQTFYPTTTLARLVKADNGHVQDIMLDSAGSVPRAVSNTTIPGVVRAVWEENGNAVLMQYMDGEIIKTAYVGFPLSTTTASSSPSKAVRLQFLPDGIRDVAVSPDGKSVSYLLKVGGGVDGYVAKSDGTGSAKLFSLPLSQILLSWPAQGTLLAQTKSAAGAPGMVFSIGVQNGAVVPIISAAGITALGDQNMSHIVYQTVAAVRSSYVRDVKKGTDIGLSLDPIPEKCAWSKADTVTLFCAVPLQYLAPDYLDLWHQGAASAADSILSFNILSGKSTVLATPGGDDGGVASDIAEISASPDGKYLLFVTKGERSLWGVRLQ